MTFARLFGGRETTEAEPAKAAPAAEPPVADAMAAEEPAPPRKLSPQEQAAEYTIAQLGDLCPPELAAALRNRARVQTVRSELERRLAQAKSGAQGARTVEEAMDAGTEVAALQAAISLLREPELPLEAAETAWRGARALLTAAETRLRKVPKPRYLQLVDEARLFRQEMPVRLPEDVEAQKLYSQFQERYADFRKALSDLERQLANQFDRPTADAFVRAADHAKAVVLAQLLPPLDELAERARSAAEKADAARRDAGLI